MPNNQRSLNIGIVLYHINPESIRGLTIYALSLLQGFKNVDRQNQYFLLIRQKDYDFFKKYEENNFKIVIIKSFDKNRLLRRVSTFLQNYILIFPVLRTFYSLSDRIFNSAIINEIDSLNLDWLYFPSGVLYPISIKTKSVVSIHDIQYDHFPNFFNIFERFGREIAHRKTVARARFIQASSEFSKKDFTRYFRCNPNKFTVIRDGVDGAFNNSPLAEDEVLRMRKNGLHAKAVIFVNTDGFYSGLKVQLQKMTREGFLKKDIMDGTYFADTPEEAMQHLD